jgi:hypothetical protein
MRRRVLLSAVLAWPLRADSAQEAWEALTEIASALGRGNAAAFAAVLDPEMRGYRLLRDDVTALLQQAEVQCALDLIDNTGDESSRTIVVDWLMNLTERTETERSTRRRQTMTCRFRRAKRWLVTEIEPAGFFKPPRA